MEILGVGPAELMFIVLIALILLGPKDMIAAGRTIGKFLRAVIMSPTWQAMRKTGEELQQLPTKLVREAGLEDIQNEIQSVTNSIKPLDIRKSFGDIQMIDTDKSLVLPSEPERSVSFPTVPNMPSAIPPSVSTPTDPKNESSNSDSAPDSL